MGLPFAVAALDGKVTALPRALRRFRAEPSANAFLEAPCAALGGVPLELATSGRAAEVLFYLERLEHVAPAEKPEARVPGYRPSA